MEPFARPAAVLAGIFSWLLAAGFVSPAYAQSHGHGAGGTLSTPEILAGFSHGLMQASAAFLVGLAAFATLVWLPAVGGADGGDAGVLRRVAWGLVALLAVAWVVEIPVYVVRATGDPLSPGLLTEGFFGTRLGRIWLLRLALGLLTAFVISLAARAGRKPLWWLATGLGGVMLMTLTGQSHAAAEGRLLLIAADWVHVAGAAVWMGGLLGFPAMMLGPLRGMEPGRRTELLGRVVRRFSKVATVAVAVIVATGLYASLINLPSPQDLIATAYGRALIMKLGLVVLLLATGGINLVDRGKGPFGRMVGLELVLAAGVFVAAGFLTSLPPPD